MEVRIESQEEKEAKRRIRVLTDSILRCETKDEADVYRPQLQKEERRLESIMRS